MLIDSIRAIFGSKPDTSAAPNAPKASEPDPLHLAACTLLLEVAHADGEFSASEQEHLALVLERHFSLPAHAGKQLLELADQERKSSVDHYRFTSRLLQAYDTGQKMVLAEIMWGIVLADGEIASHEQYLTRKISNLLNLEPGYLSAARAAAENRQSS